MYNLDSNFKSDRKSNHRAFLFRRVVLSASAFDSKTKFLTDLRCSIGSGVLNLSGWVTSSTISDFYTYLKEDLDNPCDFYKADHLGYQEKGYWILSRDVSAAGHRQI
jgi:hypothetical protein